MNTVKLNYGYPNSEMKDNLQVEIKKILEIKTIQEYYKYKNYIYHLRLFL